MPDTSNQALADPAGADVRIIAVGCADTALLEAVIRLADRHRATLGQMPRGAFTEFAINKTLFAAVTPGDELVGYALFAIAKNRVRLIHLCTDATFRRAGYAAQLVDTISDKYHELNGIVLRCRADYEARHLWPSLGFAAVNEVEGRGKEGVPLVVWWRTHNRPNLFTPDEDDVAMAVAIDHNVFIDLAVNRSREGAAESQSLEADWLHGQIRLAVTSETLNEILRLDDVEERRRQRAATTAFPVLEHTPAEYTAAAELLRSAAGEISARDASDFSHVVHAAAGGASVFVTRDSEWIATIAEPASTALGLRVLRPSDIVAHLDELRHAEKYRLAALRGTGYTVRDTPAGSESSLEVLLAKAHGEKRSNFVSLLRALSANRQIVSQEVRDPAGNVVLAWAAGHDPASNSIAVPLLRSSTASLAATVARLVLFRLKANAVDRGATSVIVTDSYPSNLVVAALAEDGFVRAGSTYVASVLTAFDLETARSDIPVDHPALVDLDSALEGKLAPARAAQLERTIWPAKLLDSGLRNYLVPIQPRWARELFSLQDTLWERNSVLGISREHVYYRYSRGNPVPPARILWYASGTGRERIGAVVACSQLIDVVTDTPRRLFRKFEHLGVYHLDHLRARATGGVLSALRFVDTEMLDRPVPFHRLRYLNQNCPIGSLQSPTMITNQMFGAVYREGARRDER